MSGKKKTRKPVYCWDSCTILAWFKQETDKPLDDIALIVEQVENDKAALVLSVITLAEVLDSNKSGSAATEFRDWLVRKSVNLINVDPRIAEKASSLRVSVLNNDNYESGLKTPDAVILATGIIYGVDVIHSFDPDLLRLNGTDDVDGIKITKPKILSGQKSLEWEQTGDEEQAE